MAETSPDYCLASTSSEGSTESSLSPSINTKLCQVCGQNGHGSHFGAFTCRACAAFFRRVAAGANFVIKCRKGAGNCEIVTNGRSCYKKCRLRKCKEIGMNIENFQFDRDPISTTKQVPQSLAMLVGRPQFIISCDPETAAKQSGVTFIDLSNLMEKVRKLFLSDNKIPLAQGQNRLRKLSIALNYDRKGEDFQEITKMGLKETINYWEHVLLSVSKWLVHFDEFQQLDTRSKLKLLETIWFIWSRAEKLCRIARFLKGRNCSEWDNSTVFVAEECKLNLKKMELDIGWLTNYSVDQVAYCIEGVGDWNGFTPIPFILELDPTDVEMNYMLAQISFSYASKELNNELSEVAENFLQLLADDLHNYYTREMDVTKYSDRVLKMMKVNNMIMKTYFKKKERIDIARTFDIFRVNFSEPEMFKYLY